MADPIAYASVSGVSCTRVELYEPTSGVWWADCDFVGDDEIPTTQRGAVLRLGDTTFTGTLDPAASGVFVAQRKVRIVGGAGAWGRQIGRVDYHNDAAVRARLVAEDAAREAGETLGTFTPTVPTVGIDYVRREGPASRALEAAAKGAPWWVGRDGVTHVAATGRTAGATDPAACHILDWNPRHRELTLAAEDLATLQPGATLAASEAVPEDLTFATLRTVVTAGEIRVTAWCDGSSVMQAADSLRAIVNGIRDARLYGIYRYRVVSMSGDRVKLQSARRSDRMPDIIHVSMKPGAPGMHARLAAGSEAYVQFEGGDPTLPIVTQFAGTDGDGHVPDELVICGGAQRAFRQGDLVQSGGPGAVCVLWPTTGVPAPPNAAVVAGVPHYISFGLLPVGDLTSQIPLMRPLYGAGSTGAPRTRIG